MQLNFRVLKNFLPLWQKHKGVRYFILMGGRGAGRSTAASQFVASRLFGEEYMRCAIMRAIHSDIRSSIWQEINDRIDEQGARYVDGLKILDNAMSMKYGQNSFYAHGFRASSTSNTAKLKSLASYNTIVIDEAEEVGETEFMTLDDSLRTVKGEIMVVLCLNPPPKDHWIINRWFDLEETGITGFFAAKKKKTEEDAIYLSGTYLDNVKNLDAHTIKKYEQYEEKKPDYFHHRILGLVPETVRGKIYTGWQQIDRIPEQARLVRFGLDYGWHPDPAALVAIYYWNGSYIIDEVAYGTELSNSFLSSKIKDTGNARSTADSAEPKSIEEMRGHGVDIEGCEKGKGSVEYGIKVVSDKKIYVTRRSVNVWKSYENYAWAEDKDGNPKNEPCHDYSHAMDAIRYGIVSLHDNTSGSSVKMNTTPGSGYGRASKVRMNTPKKI